MRIRSQSVNVKAGKKMMGESSLPASSSEIFIAVILYEASSNELPNQPLYEESFVLIKAASLDEARTKALSYAQQSETSYRNERDETITWSLKRIIDVSPILSDFFEEGAELYSRHFRNYEAYCAFEPMLLGEL
jgi:hypothetical protein